MPSKNSIKQIIDSSRDFRIKQEALWMELDHMIDGNHYVYYDPVTNGVRVLPQSKRGTVRRTVNLVRAKIRSSSNMINKNEPAFNVRPNYSPYMEGEERAKAREGADVMNHLLTYCYRKNNMREQFKAVVRIGLKRGLAIGQLTWDEDKDDIYFDVYDPFDILIDPLCEGDLSKAQFIIKSTVCSLDALEKNSKYKIKKKPATTSQLSTSAYRDSYLQSKYSSERNEDRVIVHEVWSKEEKENEEGEMECKVKVDWYLGDDYKKPIRSETFEYESFPFFLYYPERIDGELYPRPMFADIIGLNKSIDAIYSFVEEYIGTTAIGRYLKHKKSKLTTQSTGRHGQVIEWTGDVPITPMDVPRIPMDVIQLHLNNTERYMAEIAGMQFMDVDKITAAGTSGRAIAQLQAQQAESVGEPTDNLARFAKEVFKFVLEMYKTNMTEARMIPNMNDDSDEVYKVRGAAGLVDGMDAPKDETIIDEIPDFRVEIVPGSAFSEIQKRADVAELYQMQLVDKETVLEAYQIGSTREVIDKMKREQAEQQEAELNRLEREGNIKNLLAQEQALGQQNQQMNQDIAGLVGERRAVDPALDATLAQAESGQAPVPTGEAMLPPM